MDLKGKRVIVVGLGRSGQAAARLARRLGAEVVATDLLPLEKLPAEAKRLDAMLVAGTHEGVPFDHADLVVVSPGVPDFAALRGAVAAGVPVVGELEFASRRLDCPLIAVGGTNGKSTVTTLIGGILKAAGYRAFVGGNLGTPLVEALEAQPPEVAVVEVSSFQMERVELFHPQVSILLNVTEDHLDRYLGLSDYANAKGNAFLQQTPEDTAVVPADDFVCQAQARRGRARLVTFGKDGDYSIEARTILEEASGHRISLEGSRLFGHHNVLNAAAAMAAVRSFGVDLRVVADAIREFEPLRHRMAFVREVAGVRFYDDSKGTNVGASVTALLGLAEPRGVLIAGGRDKQGSYQPLVAALREKGRGLVVMGEARERIAEAAAGAVPIEIAGSMEEAVQLAQAMAEPGDAVLLSPACSSFDMFQDYAERGRKFVAAVEALGNPEGRKPC